MIIKKKKRRHKKHKKHRKYDPEICGHNRLEQYLGRMLPTGRLECLLMILKGLKAMKYKYSQERPTDTWMKVFRDYVKLQNKQEKQKFTAF